MTSHEILTADPLDILFENRNKTYGAYVLRKFYSDRLLLSLFLALAGAALLSVFLMRIEEKVIDQSPGPDVIVRSINLPPEKPKDKIIPRQSSSATKPVATVQNTTIKIVKQTDNVVADQRQLLRSAIGSRTIDGSELEGIQLPKIPEGPKTQVGITGGNNPSHTELVQREPEFPGGMAAWIRFLQRNLQTPGDLEAGQKKTVMMRFLVAVDGSVTGFEVLQSAGTEYDQEVMRVLQRMPKWKPAIQNGFNVARSFTQPVTFIGEE